MAIVVEHDKRRHEILSKALELFVEEGYEDVTFQKIADRCGITRTTLYIYFKNKREIFLWSIKQLTGALEAEVQTILVDESLSAKECLIKMMRKLIDGCLENANLFYVLLNYLFQLQKSGVDTTERISRRIIRIQHLMNTVVIRGIKNGEFLNIPVNEINNLFYSLIESAIFRLSVLHSLPIDQIYNSINLAVNGICVNKGE